MTTAPTAYQTVVGTLSSEAVTFFVLFVLSTLGITWWAAKRTRTTKEFYAAGRSITGFQNGLALAGQKVSTGIDKGGNMAAPIVKYKNPGVFSMGGAFLVGIAVSLLTREPSAESKFEDEKLRAYVGIGAE